MPLTPAEKQKRYRDRQREKAAAAIDPVDAISKQSFFEFLNEFDHDWIEVTTSLEWAGIDPKGIPVFDADDDPGHDPGLDGDEPNRGSIGRAERMVGNLLDAATGLAAIVNRYKRSQITAAIAELEDQLSDPARKKDALAEIVRLNKLLERLDKQHRHQLPQWTLKGA